MTDLYIYRSTAIFAAQLLIWDRLKQTGELLQVPSLGTCVPRCACLWVSCSLCGDAKIWSVWGDEFHPAREGWGTLKDEIWRLFFVVLSPVDEAPASELLVYSLTCFCKKVQFPYLSSQLQSNNNLLSLRWPIWRNLNDEETIPQWFWRLFCSDPVSLFKLHWDGT